jgi:U2-associated protein SR140
VQVKLPDAKQRFIIDSMALYVLKDGCEFEQMIMMEQQGRPEFDFMFDLDSDEHAYYRWRLYSLAGGSVHMYHQPVVGRLC